MTGAFAEQVKSVMVVSRNMVVVVVVAFVSQAVARQKGGDALSDAMLARSSITPAENTWTDGTPAFKSTLFNKACFNLGVNLHIDDSIKQQQEEMPNIAEGGALDDALQIIFRTRLARASAYLMDDENMYHPRLIQLFDSMFAA